MRPRRKSKTWLEIDALEQRALLTLASGLPDLYYTPATTPGPLSVATPANSAVVRLTNPGEASVALKAIYQAGAYVDGAFDDLTWGIVFRPGVSRDGVLHAWQDQPWLADAKTDSAIQASALNVNDPMVAQQWAVAGGSAASVNAEKAWSRTAGQGVVVAVIDSGIDLAHPEFQSQLWVNTAELSGNRKDDDRDGFVDDVNGANFINQTGQVQDDADHGTFVSGIIAAAVNNTNGGVGLAPGAKIMALKVLDSAGNGSLNAAVNAIYYAVNHGAKVINASWTMSVGSPSLQAAITYASSRNVVFVTAAGNEGVNNDITPSYPGNYRYSNVLTVTAVDSSGKLADFSNYGKTSVDVAAPGMGIMSTVRGGYDTWDGTSMATPYVAATAALVASRRPDYTAAQIVAQIKATVHHTTDLTGKVASGGFVDAAAATDLAPYVPPPTPAKPVVTKPTPASVKPTPKPKRTPLPKRSPLKR